jgi:oligosaccharyltransferase complex subunit delta (ribophorin II)
LQTLKDLPAQFLATSNPLQATLVLGSFGPSTSFSNHVFNLDLGLDPSIPVNIPEKPLRYGKLSEIHHIFRQDPKSPPIIITLVFLAAVIACLPALFTSVGLPPRIFRLQLTYYLISGYLLAPM